MGISEMGFSDFLLKLLNGIFAVGGLVLIGIGAYVLIEVGEYSVLTNDTFNAIPIAIMVFGGFILIMALIGLCGALGNSPCVLKTYSVILTILLLLEITLGIIGFVKKDLVIDLVGDIATESINSWKYDETDGPNEYALAWDSIHKSFDCCGAGEYQPQAGFKDWSNQTIGLNFLNYAMDQGWAPPPDGSMPKNVEYPVPDSCCKNLDSDDIKDCGLEYISYDKINTKGCVQGLVDWVEDNIAIIAGAAVGMAVIQLFLIIAACTFTPEMRIA